MGSGTDTPSSSKCQMSSRLELWYRSAIFSICRQITRFHSHKTRTGNCCKSLRLTHIRRHLSFPPLATLCPSGLQSTAYTCTRNRQVRKCHLFCHGEHQEVALVHPSPRQHDLEGRCWASQSWCPRLSECCRCCRWPAACCQLTMPPDTQTPRGPAGTSGTLRGILSQNSASPAPPCGTLLHSIHLLRKVTRQPYFPVRPSQILIDLSNEAEAISLVSGEKRTSLTSALWPVILARGFLSSAGFHRNMVKSSEPDTKRSGAEPCGVTTEVRMVAQDGGASGRMCSTQYLPWRYYIFAELSPSLLPL